MAHSEKISKRQMVDGERSRSQCTIGLPLTVYCLPHALRSALSALHQEGSPKPGPLGPDSLLHVER
jgi:hypothetical protein